MVVKEFLENHGVDQTRFTHFRKNKNPVVRRSLRRMFGGETTIPVPRPNKKIKDAIIEKINSGEYTLGKMVVPKQYKRLVIKQDGSIEEETFYVSGRQIPLEDIRVKTLQEHENNGWVRDHSDAKYVNMIPQQVIQQLKFLGEYDDNDDLTLGELKKKLQKFERTRHLLAWSDHSCILNHGHLLLTVNVMYDPAFYFTREELKLKTGKDIDIETLVQKPQVYIMGRCSDQVADQLCYMPNRINDIVEMEVPVLSKCGVTVTDVMRFFHGDHPAQAVEAGQQDGGHYPCCICPLKACAWTDLTKCYRAPCVSMQDRIDEVRIIQPPFYFHQGWVASNI